MTLKRNLAQKITMSLVAGALLFSNGVVWADTGGTGTQTEDPKMTKVEGSFAQTDIYAAHTQSAGEVNLEGYSLIVEGKVLTTMTAQMRLLVTKVLCSVASVRLVTI